ncbi:MAG: GNAT family N-acetyltransferase, partial [Defluviitaleaceae bacterium]|nr:GNAT family N-acetyltransferase [Defluviitaleaceae bacterium]
DKEIVFKHGYKLTYTLKYMVRPSESIECTLPEGFLCLPVDKETNLDEVAMALKEGYGDGFVFDTSGELKIEEVLEGLKNDLNRFSVKNSCYKIVEVGTEKIVAVCLAGVAETSAPMFNFIHELTVLSKYRGNGLGKYLINRVVNDSNDSVPFVKLAFIVGNEAELLYENLGFVSSSGISDFERR